MPDVKIDYINNFGEHDATRPPRVTAAHSE
jgi:hypothetical protein